MDIAVDAVDIPLALDDDRLGEEREGDEGEVAGLTTTALLRRIVDVRVYTMVGMHTMRLARVETLLICE